MRIPKHLDPPPAESRYSNTRESPSSQSRTLQFVLAPISRAALGDASWQEALQAIVDFTHAKEAALVRRHDSVLLVSSAAPRELEDSGGEWTGEEKEPIRLRLRGLPAGAIDEPLFALLAQQCSLSWQVQDRLALSELQVHWSQFAMDRLAFGVLLLDGSAKVQFANRSARQLLAEPGELSIDNECLVAATALYSKRLTALLARVFGGEPAGTGRSAALLRVPFGAHEEVLELLVAAIAPTCGSSREIAVGLLYTPKSGAATPTKVLRSLYGLTEAESKVVHRLLRGRTVEQASDDLGVAQDTIRQHLKSIFVKVRTTRQSDLIAALLTGPGELRWD